MIRLAAQTRLVPGDSLREKHDNALRFGLDGIELQGFPMISLAEEALSSGVPVSAMCSGHRGWFIDPDPEEVRACIDDVKRLLEFGADLDTPLIIVPIYGRTHYLPAHCQTGRTPAEDEALWLEGLAEVTAHADRVGGKLLIEAINRYQNGVSVKLADAVRFAAIAASPRVQAMADFFHMNIEEASIRQSLEEASSSLGYIHLADSNRFEPGAGHLDFDEIFAGLASIGYQGWAALECNWTGPAEETLTATVQLLRRAMAHAEETPVS